MPHRIEAAKTGRAGCQDTHCRREGIKIEKGEPRFGTWVEIEDHGSFHWKHWGCVSGRQIEHLREYLLQGDSDGPYQWEFMDGLGEMDDDFQRKFKTAVIEGKIADEDWNGDPEFNRLGQVGIRARYKKPKPLSENGDDDAEEVQSSPQVAPKKRARPQKTEDGDEKEIKLAKKPATKAKTTKKEAEEDSDYEQKGSKGAKEKKVTAKVEYEQDVPIKAEKPARTARSKKAAIKLEEEDDSVEDQHQQKPSKAARGRKKTASKVKAED